MKTAILISLLAIGFLHGVAQGLRETRVDIREDGEAITNVFERIEHNTKLRFFYSPDWLGSITVKDAHNGLPVDQFLQEIFRDTDFSYKFMFDYAVIILKDPTSAYEYRENLSQAIRRKKIIESVTYGDKNAVGAGQRVSLKGNILDKKEGKAQGNIAVLLNNIVFGVSDDAGNYGINTIAGDYLLTFKSVNFEEKVIDLHLYKSATYDVILEEGSTLLEEVVVAGQNVDNNIAGQSTISVKNLQRSASLLGEVDIIKQVQSQAGVTTVGEVASGFNVRGGGVDQNLILFDDIPVFNSYHALGFFSSFNGEMVKRATFYRGGIPAQFGGRVSSVLSVVSKDGANDQWHGGGGIGVLNSYLFAGGPLKKNFSNLFVSARGTYSDWLLNTIKSNYANLQNSSVQFYDASLRYDQKISDRSKLFLSAYASQDNFTLTNDTTYSYRTLVASLHYQHSFSNKLTGNVTFGVGDYQYSIEEKNPGNAFDLSYGVTYPTLKVDFNYDGKHNLAFGWHTTYYDFRPGTLNPSSQNSDAARIAMENERSLESALYISDTYQWNKAFNIEAGIRLSAFNRIGAGTVYHYAEGKPKEVQNIIDSTAYAPGESMKTYFAIEPRLSLRYSLHDNASLKLGYNRIYQYLHLVSNTAAVTPVDIWQSSNADFKPQIADQISLGYYRNFDRQTYEAYAEVFYKTIDNILDFKDGSKLILNRHLETALLPGKGKAYGVELSVQKARGRLQGAANYTYSRSTRIVNGKLEGEKINLGKEYASNYDQPHVLNLEWRYGISRRHFFSGNFTYHTGRPMSLPGAAYEVDGVPIMDFSERNKFRIPDYHRLDVAFIIEGNHKRKKIWDGTWTISFYNLYGRKNAYSVFFKQDESGTLKPYKLSVIGTVVPSVSYGFKF